MWPLSYEKFMNMIIYHLIILLLHELVFCSLFLYPGNKSHLVNMNYSFNSQFDILIQLKNWFWNYFCSKGKLRTLNFSSDFSLSLWFQFSAMNVQCFQIGFFFLIFIFTFCLGYLTPYKCGNCLVLNFFVSSSVMLNSLLNAMLTLSCSLQLMS